ncbi:MAG: DnaA ATPase domain-containing protein [Phycisphaerales bacterium JB050]
MTIDPAPVQTIRTASDETKLVERLIGQIGRDRYTRFFDGSVRIESTPQAMVLQVGSEFESDLLQRRFAGDVERAVVEVRGEGAVVRWEVAEVRPARVVAPEHTNPIPLHATQRLSQSKPQPVRSRAARTRYTLDTLVVGRTNRMAVNAALELAAQKQVAGISALFVHGPCGVGKTHLLQGVAERFRRECPGARVRYVTGEAFANEFIAAVQSRSRAALRPR